MRRKSYLNTQISLLQVKFSRHYSSLIGCVSRVKTRLASVGVVQICSPYSAQLSSHSFVIIRIKKFSRTYKRIWSFSTNGCFSLYGA